MKLLLDTCTFLWILGDDPKLPPRLRSQFQDPEVEVFLSTVSSWEIAVKYALGQLSLPQLPSLFLPEMRKRHGIESLPFGEQEALQAATLPPLHRDPFDRALVCQALVHGMVIATPDVAIHRYPVRIEW